MRIQDLQQMSLECRSLALPYAGEVIDLQQKSSQAFIDPTNPHNPLAMCPYFWLHLTGDIQLRRFAMNHPEFVPWRYVYVTPLGITLKSWSLERLQVLADVVRAMEPLMQTTQMVDVSHVYDLRTVGVINEVSMALGETTWTSSGGHALTHPFIRLDGGVSLTNNERLAIGLHELAHVADTRNYDYPAGHDDRWRLIYGYLIWLHVSIACPADYTDLVAVARDAKFPPIFPSHEQAQALLAASC